MRRLSEPQSIWLRRPAAVPGRRFLTDRSWPRHGGFRNREEFLGSAADVLYTLREELRRFPPGTDLRGMAALEIGCGPGRLMLPLSETFGRVQGVDVSGEMIALARENQFYFYQPLVLFLAGLRCQVWRHI
ncbi:MAG: methyltransferase domain-containing protein [Pseudanabaena sp. RU_4_16]|nr:methyltransferase domain-containing protein [Pseudanabaena sp. RU_4_16]